METESKTVAHTGWRVMTDEKGFWWVDRVDEDGRETMCNTGTDEGAEARANLFAAAPDMLKALKWLRDEMTTKSGERSLPVDDYTGDHAISVEAYEAAIAAITLAEPE